MCVCVWGGGAPSSDDWLPVGSVSPLLLFFHVCVSLMWLPVGSVCVVDGGGGGAPSSDDWLPVGSVSPLLLLFHVCVCVCVFHVCGGGGGSLIRRLASCGKCVSAVGVVCVLLPHQTTGFLWEVCLRCWCCFMCVCVGGGGGAPSSDDWLPVGSVSPLLVLFHVCVLSLTRRCRKCVSAVGVVSCVCVCGVGGGGLPHQTTGFLWEVCLRCCCCFMCVLLPHQTMCVCVCVWGGGGRSLIRRLASCGKCVSAVIVLSCVCVLSLIRRLASCEKCVSAVVVVSCVCVCVCGGGGLPHQTTGFLWEVCLRCCVLFHVCVMCVYVCVWGGEFPHQTTVCVCVWGCGGGASLIRRLASCGKCVSAVGVVSCVCLSVCVWGGGVPSSDDWLPVGSVSPLLVLFHVCVWGGGGGSLIRRLASCVKCVYAVGVVSCVYAPSSDDCFL